MRVVTPEEVARIADVIDPRYRVMVLIAAIVEIPLGLARLAQGIDECVWSFRERGVVEPDAVFGPEGAVGPKLRAEDHYARRHCLMMSPAYCSRVIIPKCGDQAG